MKRLFILMLILAAQLNGYAQRCPSPMPAGIFRQNLNQLALKPNDQERLKFGKNMLQGACLLSSQVKDLAMVFAGDYYRFEFCKRAYKHTYDPGNFFDVYDAFGSLSAALRLYDHVNRFDRNEITPAPQPAGPWYPDLLYPVAAGYRGLTGCQLPLSDNDFEVLAMGVVAQKTDAGRRSESLKFMTGYCLSMGQMMKLATLFELESNRLAFMKEVFHKVYDLENYQFAAEVFSHLPYKSDWSAFCASKVTPQVVEPVPPVVVCEVTSQEFSDVVRSINSVAVNSTKLSLAKQVVSSKKCFTVRQIGAIMDLFAIDSSRLELALYSYDFCINKGDYYQLTEKLVTSSNKNSLIDFLKGK